MSLKVAFFAPMKPPSSPVPSGDRTFARLILSALERAGHEVRVASELVTWRPTPDGLAEILSAAARETDRIALAWHREGPPDAILTYHNYHKAPDLLGPALAERFGLPYAIVEASRAPKHATGPFAAHFRHAEAALARADAVAAVTAHDAVALAPVIVGRLVRLPPFIDTAGFHEGPRDGTRLVCAAMMRGGRKAQSVEVLADVLARVRARRPDVLLRLAGDGPERERLAPLFPEGTLLGRLDRAGLSALFAVSDIFVWPAIDEPFGFVFLEAHAAGLPVVAGRARGVGDVVRDGESAILADPLDAPGMAEAILSLLADPARRAAMGDAARVFAGENDLGAGARRLDDLLRRALHRRGAAA